MTESDDEVVGLVVVCIFLCVSFLLGMAAEEDIITKRFKNYADGACRNTDLVSIDFNSFSYECAE